MCVWVGSSTITTEQIIPFFFFFFFLFGGFFGIWWVGFFFFLDLGVVCVWFGSSKKTLKKIIPFFFFFFLHLGEISGISGVAFVSFEHMESVLDERFFQDPQTPWANSKRKLKMNSRIVSGIITGEKKEGFSKPVIYTLENIQVGEKVSTMSPYTCLELPIL